MYTYMYTCTDFPTCRPVELYQSWYLGCVVGGVAAADAVAVAEDCWGWGGVLEEVGCEGERKGYIMVSFGGGGGNYFFPMVNY